MKTSEKLCLKNHIFRTHSSFSSSGNLQSRILAVVNVDLESSL